MILDNVLIVLQYVHLVQNPIIVKHVLKVIITLLDIVINVQILVQNV